MKPAAAALAALLFAAPAALAVEAPKARTFEVRLEPGQVHEECMKLAKGQAKRFEWSADRNVDFNIHYHKGEAAYYPFKANNRKAAKARFQAEHADEYCWMWTARREPAQVSGSIK